MVCGCSYWKRNKTCPPPVSLWHADYLQLKSNKVQQTQGKTWTSSLNCLKEHRGVAPGLPSFSRDVCIGYGPLCGGANKAWRPEFTESLSLSWTSKHLFIKLLFFLRLYVNCPSSSLISQTTTPNILFLSSAGDGI